MPMTAAELVRLEALEKAVGNFRKAYSYAELEAFKQDPANTLENGEYPVFERQRMLNFAVDFIITEIGRLQQKVNALPDADPAPPLPHPGATELVDGLLWHKSTNGIGLAFESDINFQNGQRSPQNKAAGYRQVFCVALSDDGGGGIHQNLIYPEDGGRAYIPDPTRFGVSYRLDRQGMMSLNIHRAGEQFAPGKFAVTAVHKGQLAVVIPEENGNITVRLPQGGDLLIEKGNGNADRENGHKAAVSRQPVVLGADVGSPAVGGLPGGGGT